MDAKRIISLVILHQNFFEQDCSKIKKMIGPALVLPAAHNLQVSPIRRAGSQSSPCSGAWSKQCLNISKHKIMSEYILHSSTEFRAFVLL